MKVKDFYKSMNYNKYFRPLFIVITHYRLNVIGGDYWEKLPVGKVYNQPKNKDISWDITRSWEPKNQVSTWLYTAIRKGKEFDIEDDIFDMSWNYR